MKKSNLIFSWLLILSSSMYGESLFDSVVLYDSIELESVTKSYEHGVFSGAIVRGKGEAVFPLHEIDVGSKSSKYYVDINVLTSFPNEDSSVIISLKGFTLVLMRSENTDHSAELYYALNRKDEPLNNTEIVSLGYIVSLKDWKMDSPIALTLLIDEENSKGVLYSSGREVCSYRINSALPDHLILKTNIHSETKITGLLKYRISPSVEKINNFTES